MAAAGMIPGAKGVARGIAEEAGARVARRRGGHSTGDDRRLGHRAGRANELRAGLKLPMDAASRMVCAKEISFRTDMPLYQSFPTIFGLGILGVIRA